MMDAIQLTLCVVFPLSAMIVLAFCRWAPVLDDQESSMDAGRPRPGIRHGRRVERRKTDAMSCKTGTDAAREG